VVLHVLLHHRRQRDYDQLQRAHDWREFPQPAADEVRVGVMGMGVLGRDAAEKLRDLGFRVAGWSQTPKAIAGIESFSGAGGLEAFLGRTDILVCLLPLTPQTRGLIDAALIAKLARDGAGPGPYLINAGRGGLQVEADILAALDGGLLAGATLDVFETEPLPATSPLWDHPLVTITPHNASISDPRAVGRQILGQIATYEAGGALVNLVDPQRAY
jgi:glyoxylate/hydroxypyruvate reductase A